MTFWFQKDVVRRVSISFFIMMAIGCWLLFTPDNPVGAQVRISPTPVSASLPQVQPQQSVEQEAVFVSPTPAPTETPEPGVFLEVKADLGTADVRGMPDPEGDALDPIKTGDRFLVTGRYFRWIQFRYDKALSGYGWVFEDLVNLNGTDAIPNIDPYATPSITPVGGNVEETRLAVTLTPGAVETLDAQSRLIVVPSMEATGEVEDVGVLPTYTKPAELAPRDAPAAVQEAATNALEDTLVRAATGQIPPIVPVLMLAGAGMLGMIVSLWRR
jgi:hypothetical protein